MKDEEWVDLVAGARARYTGDFDLGDLYQRMIRLGALNVGDGYHAFIDDVRARAISSEALQEQEDGRWRFTAAAQEEAQEEPTEEEEVTEQEGTQEGAFAPPAPVPIEGAPAQPEAQPVAEAAAAAQAQQDVGTEVTYERELIVERQGVGQWALWDSATQQWETIGKESEAIKLGRDRGKDSAAQGVAARMRVVGKERQVKYERTYAPGKTRTPRRAAAASPDAPARPPLPGDPVPAATPPTPTSQTFVNLPVESQMLEINVRERSLTLITKADGRSTAFDPDAVVLVDEVQDGYVSIVMQDGSRIAIASDLLSVVAIVDRGRA